MSDNPAFVSTHEALGMLRTVMGYLAATDHTAMAAEAQAECLLALEEMDAVETAIRAKVLGAFTAAQGYSADADYSPRSWLIHRTRITRGTAAGYLAWARRAAAHPHVVQALAERNVSESYARKICEWSDKLPADCRDAADAILVAAAKAGAHLEARWVARHLGTLVGLGGGVPADGDRSEAFAAWRQFVEVLAEARPLVLVFEDLHWAEDGLLDFVDYLAEWAGQVPLLVVGTARPELLARRPGWGGGKPNALTLSLAPLSEEDTARLIGLLAGRPVLEAGQQAMLLAQAGGNPLYAEQYAQMLTEHGAGQRPPPTAQPSISAAAGPWSGHATSRPWSSLTSAYHSSARRIVMLRDHRRIARKPARPHPDPRTRKHDRFHKNQAIARPESLVRTQAAGLPGPAAAALARLRTAATWPSEFPTCLLTTVQATLPMNPDWAFGRQLHLPGGSHHPRVRSARRGRPGRRLLPLSAAGGAL